MKMYRVTWYFKDGAAYAIPVGSNPPGGLKVGQWEAQFPYNEYLKGDEDFWPIGDVGFINGALREMHGQPVRVLVEDWPEGESREG